MHTTHIFFWANENIYSMPCLCVRSTCFFFFSANARVVVLSSSDNLVFLVAFFLLQFLLRFFFFWSFPFFLSPSFSFSTINLSSSSVPFCARIFFYPFLHLDSGPSVRGLVLRIFPGVSCSLLSQFHSIYTPCSL